MMMQQLRASILSAPLAAVDRRALSQAWYSALHVVARKAPPAPPMVSPKAAVAPHATANARRSETPAARASLPPFLQNASATRPATTEGSVDRRAPRSRLARHIERAFLDPRSQRERSTFSIGEGGARVHVVLQNDGRRMRLVAICSPAHKDVVARALAQARFALASRGMPLDIADTRTSSCS